MTKKTRSTKQTVWRYQEAKRTALSGPNSFTMHEPKLKQRVAVRATESQALLLLQTGMEQLLILI